VRRRISRAGGLRKDLRIRERGEEVLIPLSDALTDEMAQDMGLMVEEGGASPRAAYVTPFDDAAGRTAIPEMLASLLPSRWELLGDVLLLRFPAELDPYEREIGRAYAQALHARTVCRETGVISGVHRTPKVEVIFGQGTETVHKENGILYKLDVSQVMFSSGNMDEKRRMSELDCREETVVDMFAGIGYFSLPLAVHAGASRVIACEINPVAFGYLRQNIALNHVEGVVEPVLGDNRDLPGKRMADRVVMGYVGTTDQFLPKAFELIRPGGVVHYHETCSVDEWPDQPLRRIRENAGSRGVEVLRAAEVKSYAPAISHYVIDFQVTD